MAASKMASPALTQPPLLDEPKRSALVAAQPEAALAKQHSRAGVQSLSSHTAPGGTLAYQASHVYEHLSHFVTSQRSNLLHHLALIQRTTLKTVVPTSGSVVANQQTSGFAKAFKALSSHFSKTNVNVSA